MSNKYYIGFGTNDYPNLGSSSSLQKCESDVANLGDALLSLGFNICYFIGKDTTKENIILQIQNKISELYKFFESTNEKQYLLISRSSHGSQQPDINGDESDNVDECWMCYDSAWNKEKDRWDNVIIDDELCNILNSVDKNKIDIDVISDTCHSGTFTRDIPQIILNRKFVFPHNFKQYKTKHIKKSWTYQYWIKTETDWALFAGAESDNFSYETARGGALTSAIIDYVGSGVIKSKKEAAKIIIDNVRRNMPKQRPHLECSSATSAKQFLGIIKPKEKSFWEKILTFIPFF